MASRELVRAVSSVLSVMFLVRLVAELKAERVCSLGDLQTTSADSQCELFESTDKVYFQEAFKGCSDRGARLAVMNLGDMEPEIFDSFTDKKFWIDENSVEIVTGNGRRPHGNGVKQCKTLLIDDEHKPEIKFTSCSTTSYYLCQSLRPDMSKDINEDSTSLGPPGYTVHNRDKVLGTEGTPIFGTKSNLKHRHRRCHSTHLCSNKDDLSLARYYGDHMVLQRQVEDRGATLWGYAAEVGDDVRVEIEELSQSWSTTAQIGLTGRPQWRVTMMVEEGGPYAIKITSNECEIIINNVLFGDVWFCSGQSNMVHRLDRLDDPEPDLEDIENHPNVRTFQMSLVYNSEPQHDLISVARGWAVPTRNQVQSFSAICWLFGKRMSQLYNRPIGLIQSAWGGTRIETWSSPDALEICYPGGAPPGGNQNQRSVLWNAMLHPFLQLTVSGALWYQGESNRGQAVTYECAFREMVRDWRAKWQLGSGQTEELFPFGEVQLAPWRDSDVSTGFPDVRWAQAGFVGNTPTENLPNVFMAVAMDLPDYGSPYGNIHPRYKRQIADRLVLGARSLAYGEDVVFQGPLPSEFTFSESNTLIMDYGENAMLELRINDKNTYFEACCSSDVDNDCLNTQPFRWVPAAITTHTETTVSVEAVCGEGEVWVGVRYAWRESPCQLEMCPLYSNNLPAPTFRKVGLQE